MKRCLVCGQARCVPLIDFGQLPISHHFYDGVHEEYRHPMVLGQCEHCAQAQLLTPCPPERLVPRYDWLVNNEPEAHLDALVATLCELPGVKRICGVSHKDESTLRRLRERGLETHRLELKGGVETIQQLLTPELARSAGKFDLVVARHILEHTHDPLKFLAALRELGRYVVVEIPDCAMPFELLDYTAMWEEHTLYFDEATLRHCLNAGGFRVPAIHNYRIPYETAVVAIATPGNETTAVSAAERQRARAFAEGFPGRRAMLRSELQRAGKVALFGAGHHASIFTNIMGVADLIQFVVDDNPHKRGLQMPGTRLPIVGSEELLASGVSLCLSSLGYGSEQKVRAKLRDFRGQFVSIFPIPP